LVKISKSCLVNNIPAYGDCLPVTDTITEITSDIGAAVQVILGGVPDADYPITISHADLDPVIVCPSQKLHPDKIKRLTELLPHRF
jgi:hypothetical protein